MTKQEAVVYIKNLKDGLVQRHVQGYLESKVIMNSAVQRKTGKTASSVRNIIGRRKTMSVSKWAYDPEHCDHGVCVGDCDLCDQGEERAVQNLCDILAGYLDRHPDKVIFSTVHIVNCKWKHEIRIVDKKAQVK